MNTKPDFFKIKACPVFKPKTLATFEITQRLILLFK
tara:strand:+ start:949 stop:1056 length:108 start_codon:yes stop_codon:yes gene_type:complete